MYKLLVATAIILSAGCWHLQGTDEQQRLEYPKGPDALPLLEEMWRFGAENIYPTRLAKRFDQKAFNRLEEQLRSGDDAALADVLNPFFDTLGVSHTRFYDRRHQSYYLLRSLFSTHDLDEPKLRTIGVLLDDRNAGVVRAIMEDSPADAIGVERGDRIVAVDGAPFRSLLQWQHAGPTELTIESNSGRRNVTLSPIRQGFHRALARASTASHKVVDCEDRRIGYIHLWSGTNNIFLDILNDAVASAQNAQLDGFILDLRDGYGGAWFEYLDPFFENRDQYFVATNHNRQDEPLTFRAEQQTNSSAWNGPLTVIINSGTRSGKESLAFQFKKSGRAKLFGTTTAGAFTGGLGAFAERDVDYILYLSVQEARLDGVKIEGVGVSPDVVVRDESGHDAPFSAALGELGCQIARN